MREKWGSRSDDIDRASAGFAFSARSSDIYPPPLGRTRCSSKGERSPGSGDACEIASFYSLTRESYVSGLREEAAKARTEDAELRAQRRQHERRPAHEGEDQILHGPFTVFQSRLHVNSRFVTEYIDTDFRNERLSFKRSPRSSYKLHTIESKSALLSSQRLPRSPLILEGDTVYATGFCERTDIFWVVSQ